MGDLILHVAIFAKIRIRLRTPIARSVSEIRGFLCAHARPTVFPRIKAATTTILMCQITPATIYSRATTIILVLTHTSTRMINYTLPTLPHDKVNSHPQQRSRSPQVHLHLHPRVSSMSLLLSFSLVSGLVASVSVNHALALCNVIVSTAVMINAATNRWRRLFPIDAKWACGARGNTKDVATRAGGASVYYAYPLIDSER